ncbi:MAG: GNAT family N-acetyltransferase [Janthinobacterium lividum]
MIEIIHRALTRGEAVRLHEELKTTPNILGYTVRELERLLDVHVAEVNGDFAGVCFCVDLSQNWTEVAALYVLPEFRGAGVGKMLFDKVWKCVQARQRHVYILSRNSQVIGWMSELGMTVDADLWRAPLAVHWFMARYMASRHRYAESIRKRRAIARCPPLRQGIKKYVKSG